MHERTKLVRRNGRERKKRGRTRSERRSRQDHIITAVLWARAESERGAERARRLTRTPHHHSPSQTDAVHLTQTPLSCGPAALLDPCVMRFGWRRPACVEQAEEYKNGHALACCGLIPPFPGNKWPCGPF